MNHNLIVDRNIIILIWFSFCFNVTYQFKQIFRHTMKEELPPGTIVLRLASSVEIANSMKTHKSKLLEFSILDSMDSRFFSCHRQTSLITTLVKLDRESLCIDSEVKYCCDLKSLTPDLCILQFQITAKADNNNIEIIQVLIELEDVNDNPPSFQKLHDTIYIKENVKLGEIQRFKVSDADSKLFSTKSIELEGSHIIKEYFNARLYQDQVKLYLIKHLDREQIDSFKLIIIAIDGGDNPNTGTLVVNINITDINDNQPKWITENFSVSIKEDAPINFLIIKLLAEDKDAGNNGKVYYEFEFIRNEEELRLRNLFLLNSLTGELRVQQKLDYEYLQSPDIKLHVIAKDNGEELIHSISAVVCITVIDINDNPPFIQAISLSKDKLFRVKENVQNVQQVASISVSDPDTGKGGEINCEIDNKNFQLLSLDNPLTKGYSLTTHNSIDRETISSYSITIKCHDFGFPSLTSSRILNILVQDENDNPPIFQSSIFQFKIPEKNALGQHIGRINATDKDIDENGQIIYSLSNEVENIVSIDSYSGVLTANKEFDRESTDKYSFTVFAKDNGIIHLSSSALVHLTILDVNDHYPKFETTYFFSIPENSHPGKTVGQVEATDNDIGENARITYYLEGRFPQFGIDPTSGRIILRSGSIDREKISSYELKVIASDSGQPNHRGETQVHINVEDINDNAPVFVFPSHKNNQINVSCNELPNHTIVRIQANDSDYGPAKEISYILLPFPSNNLLPPQSRHQNFFDIETNGGQLYLINKFPTCAYSYEIKVHIRAVDHGTPQMSSQTYLIVNVISDNSDKKHLTNPIWTPEKKSHWTAIISLIVATAILISFLFGILCLLKRKYSMQEINYRKGQTKPDFSHVVERPGAMDPGKLTSDEEDQITNADYRNLGTYVGFPPNHYTIGSINQKLNNNLDIGGHIAMQHYPQKYTTTSNDKNNMYQTLTMQNQYSPLTIQRNIPSKFITVQKNNTLISNSSDKKINDFVPVNNNTNNNNNQTFHSCSQSTPNHEEIDDSSETIANPMVSTYCSVSFV